MAQERAIDVPIGSAARPLPDAAVRAKYRTLAEPVLGRDAASALESAVWSPRRGRKAGRDRGASAGRLITCGLSAAIGKEQLNA
jgi:hypothetical protein